MKKYKLIKDLPTFRAGQECWLGTSGHLLTRNEEDVTIVLYSAETMSKFPNILKDWFEETPEKLKSVYDLKTGDEFWLVNSGDGEAYDYEWSEIYAQERACGDAYLTREEAEKELAWRKARQILRRDAEGFKPDWSNEFQQKWYVYYDHCFGDLDIHCKSSTDCGLIYFATEEDVKASIKAHEKEWKIYLGVGDNLDNEEEE